MARGHQRKQAITCVPLREELPPQFTFQEYEAKESCNIKNELLIPPNTNGDSNNNLDQQNQNGDSDPTLRDIKLPNAVNIRGRPKGSTLTAIGKHRQAPKPSERRRKETILDHSKPQTKSANNAEITLNCTQNSLLNYSEPIPISANNTLEITLDPTQKVWVETKDYELKESHKKCLLSNAWLDDKIINAAQSLLRNQCKSVGGLQDPVLSQMRPPPFSIIDEDQYECFVQICNINESHWVTIFGYTDFGTDSEKESEMPAAKKKKRCMKEIVNVYDSFATSYKEYPDVISIVSSLTRHNPHIETIEIRQQRVCQQGNSYDCGLYAIAFAVLLCNKIDPCTRQLDPTKLRKHLLDTFETYSPELTLFPEEGQFTYYTYYTYQ